MRALIQRVKYAEVKVDGKTSGRIGAGLLILLGVMKNDGERECDRLAERCLKLRCFTDSDGKMNLNVSQIGGGILVISQFTLCADTASGHRPSFSSAAPPEPAKRLYERFISVLRRAGIEVETGVFGADMQVELCNDGPVTLDLTEAGN